MIKEFAVENYLSFKEKQGISFEATSDKTNEEDLIYKVVHPRSGSVTKILRMTAIYGANASGKSNLILALEEVFCKLFYPQNSKEDKVRYVPFGMSEGGLSSMWVTFFINGVEYQYEVKFNKSVIAYERLRFNPNGAMSLFYERTYNKEKSIAQITFGDNVNLQKADRDHITKETKVNQSVFSTYTTANIYAPQFAVVYDYLKNTIKDPQRKASVDIDEVKGIIKTTIQDQKRREFFFDDISSADFNIKDFLCEESDFLSEEGVKRVMGNLEISSELKESLLSKKNIKVDVIHGSEDWDLSLPLELESRGTLRYFEMSSAMYDMMTSTCVYIVDEIERAVHYDILVHYIQKFLSNQHTSQLIFTTHDQLLLDEEFIRRDMVWFANKDNRLFATELYSASDFSYHKNLSIYKLYKVGKYGAKPSVGSPFITLNSSCDE